MTQKNDNKEIVIEARDLTVQFGDATVLKNVSFEVTRGSFVGLIGPNGAGKSTLLKTFLGLEKPSSGMSVCAPDLIVRYVPQQYNLPQNVPISVAEVVQMGTKKKSSHSEIADVLSYVGFDDVLQDKNYHTLSGGQKQRVIIARALIVSPDIIFFDEPLSGVDMETKNQIYTLLKKLNKEGATIFFVSHDIDHVIDVCDLVLCLDKSLHIGCHPVAFAQGERMPMSKKAELVSECLVDGEIPASKKPIHHHHKNEIC